MNDDTEVAICPQCGKEIVVALDYEPADPTVGIWGGWYGGISTDDSACFAHMTEDQVDATVEEAVRLREARERDAMEREINDEIDAMRALDAFNAALVDAPAVDWHGEQEPF